MKKQYHSAKYHNSYYLDDARLNALQIMLTARIDDLLEEFAVDVNYSNRMRFGCCPIHGGDNPQALNIYTQGESVPGYWRCYTRGCERTFKRTIIGFVRGLLSKRNDWTESGGSSQIVSFYETVDWCCDFLGTTLPAIDVNHDELEKQRFVAGMRILTPSSAQHQSTMTRNIVRRYLQIPCHYFLRRGWSAEILDRYDVGFYPHKNKPLTNRAVVPIYDPDHRFVLGFTGRSVFPKCDKCGLYHKPLQECPRTAEQIQRCCKWWNQDFKRESTMYNYWFAKKSIRQHGVAVICEGPGEVWRLEEAGIDCSCALLGTSISQQQRIILEMSGASHAIILLNNDAAGKDASEKLRQQLRRFVNIHSPAMTNNDLGDTSIHEVQKMLVPLISKLQR